jgi:sec-independent protein translocase protein TatA
MSPHPILALMFPKFLLIGPLGWTELMIILFLVLLFFGPRRLPEVAEAIGKSIRRFKKATREIKNEIESQDTEIKEGEDKRG